MRDIYHSCVVPSIHSALRKASAGCAIYPQPTAERQRRGVVGRGHPKDPRDKPRSARSHGQARAEAHITLCVGVELLIRVVTVIRYYAHHMFDLSVLIVSPAASGVGICSVVGSPNSIDAPADAETGCSCE